MFTFDLHCDTLTEARKRGLGLKNAELQLSIDRLCGAGWTQCFAIYLPDELRGQAAADYFDTHVQFFGEQMQAHANLIAPARSFAEIEQVHASGRIAAVLTVEGGAALAGELAQVEHLRRCGVRMLTLTWNGANELAGGVGAPEGKRRFTPFGRQAVGALEQAGILVDVSHLSDEAFWELCDFAKRPFVASHSNLRALCNHPRNLTDAQFTEIARRGGLVGLNFYTKFLAEDGRPAPEKLLCHLERMLTLGGEGTIALGSDFDGADMPPWLAGAGQLPWLFEQVCLRFGEGIAERLFWRNANEFFANAERGLLPGGEG